MRSRVPVAGVVAAVVMLSPAGPPAAAYEYLDGAHWGASGVVRMVDATGDPRVLEALRAFAAEWNAMRAQPSLAALPSVELTTGRPADSCSGGRRAGLDGAPAHVVVCIDDSLATAAVGGPYRVDRQGHTLMGLVKLRTSTLSWTECNLRTAVAHELGHVMGLAHNDSRPFTGGASVMMPGRGPYGRGCPAWFNAYDRDALRALYEQHAARCGAVRDAV
jgi:hypothetical protein